MRAMIDTVSTGEQQRPPHWFPKGVSGNPAGRKPGSRNKLTEDFMAAIAADFAEHGAAAIVRVRDEKPDVYLRVVAELMPRHAELDVTVDVFHTVNTTLEAYRLASELVGGDPAAGVRRLQRLAPQIVHIDGK